MRKMKKILSALLVLAMLMSMTVLPASAEETTETISVGETKTFTLDGASAAQLLFTPSESGKYILYTSNDSDFGWDFFEKTGEDTLEQIESEWWYDPNEKYNGPVIDAEAGKTYQFTVENFNEETITCSLSLVQAQNFETFEIDCTQYTGYAGETVYLNINTSPDFAFETITWSSSDPEVVDIWYAINDNLQAVLAVPGTTTLTATSESGKTASCEITVKEKPTIEEGETVELTVNYYDCQQLLFTPEETGRYILYFPEDTALDMTVMESETSKHVEGGDIWSSSDGQYHGNAYDLTAGVTYLIDIYNGYYAPSASTTVTLIKAQNYEVFDFGFTETSRYVGDDLLLEIVTGPAMASEAVTWNSSDPNVAVIDACSGYLAYLQLNAAGSSTITATSASGKTTSCVIHVVEPEALSLNEAVTFTLHPEGYLLYSFTAPADGVYSVYAAGDAGSCSIYAENETGEWIQPDNQWDRNGISGCDFAMTAGETYVFQFYHSGEAESEFEAMVSHRVRMIGDVDGNGKIQTNDAKLVLQYIVKIVDNLDKSVADVDGNGKIQTNDAKLILQYIVKIIDKFPAENEQSHEHSYTATVTKPTCTAKGYTTYQCSCGDTYKDTETAALGHDWGNWYQVEDSATGEVLYEGRTCQRDDCGATETRAVEKLPDDGGSSTSHSWGNWVRTKEPTTEAEGQETRTCSTCGATETRAVDKLPKGDDDFCEFSSSGEHAWRDWVSVYDENGNRIGSERRCAYANANGEKCDGYEFRAATESEGDPGCTDHEWGNWFSDSDGSYGSCTNCGRSVTIDKSGSDFSKEVITIINEYRAAENLDPVTWFERDHLLVRAHELTVYFSHNRPDGSWGVGTCIAAGYSSARAVVDAWMGSSSHRGSLMNPNATEASAAYNGSFWVLYIG